jgi:hypothetical protein
MERRHRHPRASSGVVLQLTRFGKDRRWKLLRSSNGGMQAFQLVAAIDALALRRESGIAGTIVATSH